MQSLNEIKRILVEWAEGRGIPCVLRPMFPSPGFNQPELPATDTLSPLQTDEFLPPMRRWLLAGALLLAGLVAGGLGLAWVIRYNVTVQAIATIRPQDELSLVQAGQAGTIRQILVKENQRVQAGEVIAELGVVDRSQLTHLQTRYQRIQAYVQQYQAQIAQIETQLRDVNSQMAQGNDPQRWLGQRDRLQQQRQGLMRQIQYDQATLQAIEAELSKQAIIVPTDGTLFNLELRNPGQTVRAGEVVAQIVPEKTALIAKARVEVQNISQVEVGQMAQLRISAYPYPDYGVLEGTVQAIAPDVVSAGENSNGMGSYYEITIQPTQPYLVKGDRQYPLQPGMEARADIISRQETVIQSLFRRLRLWADV
ncbi:MAG: HlyD family efflux transporter periplasmic adaptor subunit [Leptolyngbyaceae cyanobacterium bins.349]|nr:HlyD family efflux transporter periplasmic adaptor subunit [Leptolyngbyaceae cyanobacterium bins.349]